MSSRRCFTDRMVKALKPAPEGERLEIYDTIVPGLMLRVTDKGAKSYAVNARWKGKAGKRTIGSTERVNLKQARDTARGWLELAHQGEDPAELAKRARAAEEAKQTQTFSAAMEKFIAKKVSKQRKAVAVEREIRKELMPRFAKLPAGAVTRKMVSQMVDQIAARAPYQAHHVLGHCRVFYNWCLREQDLERDDFGIAANPCDRLSSKDMIEGIKARERVLNDEEIRAVWKAAERMGYPMGRVNQLLLLTGCRKAEVAGARWGEFDLAGGIWTIPSERFKSDRVHLVPLSTDALELLEQLPRWGAGDFLFSTTDGRKAVNGFSKSKVQLDALVVEELGHEPDPWVTHDLRRTVRTRLSQLKVPYEVAEAVIGHTKKGLHAVYDRHEAIDERREALETWAHKLRSIVEPPAPGKVLDIEEERRARA